MQLSQMLVHHSAPKSQLYLLKLLQIESQTVTEPGATITTTVIPPHRLMNLLKRVTTPTTTITVSTTSENDNYCAETQDPDCTTTEFEDYINSVTASVTVKTTIVDMVTSIIFVTSTFETTQQQTITGAEVLVTFTQAAGTTPSTTARSVVAATASASPSSSPSSSPSKAIAATQYSLSDSYLLLVLALGISFLSIFGL